MYQKNNMMKKIGIIKHGFWDEAFKIFYECDEIWHAVIFI